MSLAGRSVLVTGVHSLALVIARALVEAGARVVLHSPGDDGDLIGAATDPIEVMNEPCDTVAHAETLAAKCWESFGPLAGLVVVPGRASPEHFADTDDDWDEEMSSVLKLPFFLTRAIAQRMEKAGGGCIVNVIGTSPGRKEKPLAVNEVTCSGSVTMTLALAKALRVKVRVCAVVGSETDPTQPEACGIARTICFLLSEESLGTGVVVRLEASRR